MFSVVMRRQDRPRGVANGGVDLRIGPILVGVEKGFCSLMCLKRDGFIRNKGPRVEVNPVECDWGRKVKQRLSPVISCAKGAMR
jgi:hypothetical protein